MLLVDAQQSKVSSAFHMQSLLLNSLARSAGLLWDIADSLDRGLHGFQDNLWP
jgi:hypothetical protein